MQTGCFSSQFDLVECLCSSKMKSVLVFVFALCVVVYAYPRPAEKESKEDSREDSSPEAELFYVPLHRSEPRRPVFDFGVSDDLVPPPLDQHPFFRAGPWGVPAAEADPQVDDFMTQMQQMLTEMRRHLNELLHKSHPALPDNSSVGTRVGDSEDLPQNKTTSTTKVIDGHVVTVNETTYSSGDDNIGAVFRIKVVEVHPSETPETEGEVETEDKPEEPKEPANPNPEAEPTTSKSELEEDKHEETNEIPHQKVRYEVSPELDPSLNEIDEFSVEDFRPLHKESYYDLSDDTKVNDYLADQSEHQQLVMMEPDAEFIDTEFRSVYPQKPERSERLRYL